MEDGGVRGGGRKERDRFSAEGRKEADSKNGENQKLVGLRRV